MQVYFTLEGPIPRSAKMKQTPPPRHRRRTHAEQSLSLSHTRARCIRARGNIEFDEICIRAS
jgi:hypothetical protein